MVLSISLYISKNKIEQALHGSIPEEINIPNNIS